MFRGGDTEHDGEGGGISRQGPKISLYDSPEVTTNQRHVIAALVANEPGVLAGIAGMFAARGFNIDSLVVGRTNTSELSRMTIVVIGSTEQKDQIIKQLASLVPVWKVVNYQEKTYIQRDCLLAKVQTRGANGVCRRGEVLQLTELFSARAIDVAADEMVIELSATPDRLESFISLVEEYGIIEMARTGVIAMGKSFLPAGLFPEDRDSHMTVDDSQLPPG